MEHLRWWLALVGTVAAFGGAALASGLASTTHYAEAELVVVRGGGPLKPGRLNEDVTRSLANLLDSNLIAADVVSNLHLREPARVVQQRIRSGAVAPGLLRVRVGDAHALRAQQIAQEVTLVFPQLVAARFAGPHALRAKIWDPAHDAGTSGKGWGTSMGAAAVASVLLWLSALGATRRRHAASRARPNPVSDTVSQSAETLLPAPSEPVSDTVLQAPEGAGSETGAPAGNGAARAPAYNLVELESLVADARARFPERAEEWNAYVFYLRDYATADGALPETFRPLVEDVFKELLTTRR